MPTFLENVELFLSSALKFRRGLDVKLFTRHALFADIPATINITSELGPNGSQMPRNYTQDDDDLFPRLEWTPVDGAAEYTLICEDPDAPLWFPPMHGLFWQIKPDVTSISNEDIQKVDGYTLKGGFKYAKNLRKNVYGGPRPLLNHGEHRYFYQLVALKKPLTNVGEYPDKTKILEVLAAEKSVLAWGEWVGVCERTLQSVHSD